MTLYVLAGKYKGQKIIAPARRETRPATSLLRGMVFDSAQMFIEGACVLDLFAGSGAMGIEAISRGASSVLFNDLSEECVSAIGDNLKRIGEEERGEVYNVDAFTLLEKIQPDRRFDVALLHPPYPIGFDGYVQLVKLLGERKEILDEEAHVFLEAPGGIEKELTPIVKEHFKIKKCKGRSTWSLYHLVNL